MKINFYLGVEDLLAFYKMGLKKKSFIFKKYVFGIGVILSIALSIFDKYFRNSTSSFQTADFTSNFWYLSAYNLILVIICIFLVRLIFIAFVRMQLRKKTNFMGNRSLEIIKDKIIFSSQDSKSEYPLKTILKLEESRTDYFIYTNEISAIIVPKNVPESKSFLINLTQVTNLKITAV